jgi:hypothetical protein
MCNGVSRIFLVIEMFMSTKVISESEVVYGKEGEEEVLRAEMKVLRAFLPGGHKMKMSPMNRHNDAMVLRDDWITNSLLGGQEIY